jgi:hypothetical protein
MSERALSVDHTHDVAFFHDEKFIGVDLDLGAGHPNRTLSPFLRSIETSFPVSSRPPGPMATITLLRFLTGGVGG